MLKCFDKYSKLMEEKKEKRVLTIELDDNVKKVTITGLGDDETVVMKQDLSEEELEQATGGTTMSYPNCYNYWACRKNCPLNKCPPEGRIGY